MTVLGRLKTMLLYVRSDHLSDISACHLDPLNTKELSELLGDSSRLTKPEGAREPLFLLRLAFTLSMVLASRITCFREP